MNRLRPRLHNKDLIGQSIDGPLNIHRTPVTLFVRVMFFDSANPPRQFKYLRVGQAEFLLQFSLYGDYFCELAGIVSVYHFMILLTEIFLYDGRESLFKGWLEDEKFIRRD